MTVRVPVPTAVVVPTPRDFVRAGRFVSHKTRAVPSKLSETRVNHAASVVARANRRARVRAAKLTERAARAVESGAVAWDNTAQDQS